MPICEGVTGALRRVWGMLLLLTRAESQPVPQACQRIRPGCDRKPRKRDTGKDGFGRALIRQALCVRGGEIDHEMRHRDRFERHPADANPPDFDHPLQRLRRPQQQTAVGVLDVKTVVADEAHETPCLWGVQER